MPTMGKLRCVDLFSGAGGFSTGLGAAGFESVYAVEIDRSAAETYRANHPDAFVFDGNIAALNPRDILTQLKLKSGELELLVGGPPCQGFSTVGKKNQFDSRNQLFKHYFRIVAALRPQFVVFENVTGFQRMYNGGVFTAACSEFKDLGYAVEARILNAANFGVPQLRQRTIVLGVPRGSKVPWPLETHETANGSPLFLKPAVTLEEALGDLPNVASGGSATEYSTGPKTDYQVLMRGNERTLTEHEGPNHGKSLLRVIRHVPPGGTINDIPKKYRPRSGFANTYARLWWDRPATTITRNFGTPSSSRCIHPFLDRGLTTREGARLQSFPDGFKFFGTRTSKNLQIGNAVPPLLAQALGASIRRALGVAKVERTPKALVRA